VYAVLRHSTLKTLQQLTAYTNSYLSIVLTRIIHILKAFYLSSQSDNNFNSNCNHQNQSFSFNLHQFRILHSATLSHFLSFITTKYQSQFKLQLSRSIVQFKFTSAHVFTFCNSISLSIFHHNQITISIQAAIIKINLSIQIYINS